MTAVESGLRLDARQRAMLEAMGIVLVGQGRAERPAAEDHPAPAPRESQAPAAEAAVRDGIPAVLRRAAPSAAPAAARPVPAPAAAAMVAPAAAGVWLDAPQCLHGAADGQGGWLVVADLPPHADASAALPAPTDERRLLDNMLRALGLHQAGVPVHLACAHRAAAGAAEAGHAPDTGPRPFDEAIAELLAARAPRMVLALGPLAAQRLLGRGEPIGRLRGPARPLPAWPQAQVVASYHLDYLLRNGADKAKAWADLCAAAEAFGQGAGP